MKQQCYSKNDCKPDTLDTLLNFGLSSETIFTLLLEDELPEAAPAKAAPFKTPFRDIFGLAAGPPLAVPMAAEAARAAEFDILESLLTC